MLQCGNVDPTGILWATLYISGTFFISVKSFLLFRDTDMTYWRAAGGPNRRDPEPCSQVVTNEFSLTFYHREHSCQFCGSWPSILYILAAHCSQFSSLRRLFICYFCILCVSLLKCCKMFIMDLIVVCIKYHSVLHFYSIISWLLPSCVS